MIFEIEQPPMKSPDGNYTPEYVEWWIKRFGLIDPQMVGMIEAGDNLAAIFSLRKRARNVVAHVLHGTVQLAQIRPDSIDSQKLAEKRRTFIERMEGVLASCPEEDGISKVGVELLVEDARVIEWTSIEHLIGFRERWDHILNYSHTKL